MLPIGSASRRCRFAGCSASRRPTRLIRPARLRLREGRHQGRRRRWVRGRLEEGLLRLGVQGQGQGPQGRLPPAAELPRGPRATRRSWSSPTSTDRDPDELHQPQPQAVHRHARRPGGRRPVRGARDPASPLHRPGGAPPRHRARPDHREGRPHLRRARPGASGHAATIPQDVAHFLDRILFCLFAEDAGLLPKSILQRLSQAVARQVRRLLAAPSATCSRR